MQPSQASGGVRTMAHQSACVHALRSYQALTRLCNAPKQGILGNLRGLEKEDRDRELSCASAERIELLPESSISKSRLDVSLPLMLIEPSGFDGGKPN